MTRREKQSLTCLSRLNSYRATDKPFTPSYYGCLQRMCEVFIYLSIDILTLRYMPAETISSGHLKCSCLQFVSSRCLSFN